MLALAMAMVVAIAAPVSAAPVALEQTIDKKIGLLDHRWKITKIRLQKRMKHPILPPYDQQPDKAQDPNRRRR